MMDKSDDGTHSALDSAVEDVIDEFRRFALEQRGQISNFSRNAYKRAVHASGCTDVNRRYAWLLEHFLEEDPPKLLSAGTESGGSAGGADLAIT